MANQGEVIICRCNDITLNELINAIKDGIDDFELLRRLLKIGFGPCQGRGCIMVTARILSRMTGRPPGEILRNHRVRPPVIPVSVKYFASTGDHK